MVIKKFSILFIIIFVFINKPASSNVIVDYETQIFLNLIYSKIKSVNNINKNINFIVLSDDSINAFVNNSNNIYLTSGLIENCDDYVALAAVIAHEVGHIDRNHIADRKNSINKISNLNNISTITIIAGSLISKNPEYLQGLTLSSGGLSNIFIEFSKDQEREADFYSIETLNKLNIYSGSIINLLKTIEKKTKEKGIDEEKLKKGTHPYFKERIDIIEYLNKNKGTKLDNDLNIKFNFIKAKYLGYNSNKNKINNLEEPFKSYSNSIYYAKNGKLKKSLKELNTLISQSNNIFFLETKADILYSYGFIDESVDFYKKVLKVLPNNYYAQIRIFQNINFSEKTIENNEIIFNTNLNLLSNFYNNKNILIKYLDLSKQIDQSEWIDFFEYWINKDDNPDIIKKKLSNFKETNDKDLLNLIKIIYDGMK